VSSAGVFAELRAATDRLAAAGIGSARVDAELLLAHLLQVSRGRLLLAGPLSPAQASDYAGLIARRAAGVPVQHLTGRAPYRHLELAVGPGVFIPRPETELIVELAADRLASAALVADLCAGSGAIGLAVAQEYPQVGVYAVENDPAALRWLCRNADQAAGSITVVEADIAAPGLLAAPGPLAALAGRVDVLLSNPPYVPETAEVGPEVRHDPAQAVYAGPDGLALMPALLRAAAGLLRPGGLLVIEHDASHGEALPRLLSAAGNWTAVRDCADLAGRPRFALAVRR
jgi:release factor glutamine methyltransferase